MSPARLTADGYERKLSLSDAIHLLDDPVIRRSLTSNLKNSMVERDWRMVNGLSPKDFESQISSTLNRLTRFASNENIKAAFGQTESSLDFGAALEEGHIVLVSLSREMAQASQEDAELLARVLLNDLWTAAQERGKRKGLRPFYVYLDEFQQFVTPTIAKNLDQARGFGLHLTLAHQYPEQLIDAGPHGKQLFNSVMENACSKVVFRLTHEPNLLPMAKWLYRGVENQDEIKLRIDSTRVLGYREEEKTSRGRTTSRSYGGGDHYTDSSATGAAGSDRSEHESWTEHNAQPSGESTNWSESESETETRTPMLVPTLGKELSSVQFRSLEEQDRRAMKTLFSQKERQGIVRLVGMDAPVPISTPTVQEGWANPERVQEYVTQMNGRWLFMLQGEVAHRCLADRSKLLVESAMSLATDANEATTAKHRIS